MTKDKGQPFGKPFNYTNAEDLVKRPWYKRLWPQKKYPEAWVVNGDEEGLQQVQAYTMVDGREVRISPVEHPFIVPLKSEDDVIAVAESEGLIEDE